MSSSPSAPRSAIEQAFGLMRRGGATIIVGMPASGVTTSFDPGWLAADGQRILGSKMGSARVQIDVPKIVDLYRQNRLKLDELVSGRYPAGARSTRRSIRCGAARRCATSSSSEGGPMKIAGLKTFVVGNPPPRFGGRYFLFLKLSTDDGVEGVGEVYAASFGPKAIVAMIEDVFEHHVLGADPFQIETDLAQRLWPRLFDAARHLADGRPVRHRNGAVGHRRQGGRQAGLCAARRQGA